ncbi:MAG: hypothetical protein H6598_03635 [Flavobacteriales bacterium]|nr:hypothetical protein [Flavobacteriales bacterium]
MKAPLLLTLLSFTLYRVLLFTTGEMWISICVFIIPIALLSFGMIVRNSLKYKNWYLSPLNLTTEKFTKEMQSDISQELLYEKVKSVINDSEFKLVDEDEKQLTLLATTAPNWLTWGENIYIELLPNSNSVRITSVTIFGNYSWKKNSSNYESFIDQFEESLTI